MRKLFVALTFALLSTHIYAVASSPSVLPGNTPQVHLAGNQISKETDEAIRETVEKKFSDVKELFSSFATFITILITVGFAVFGLLIAVNLVGSAKVLEDARRELSAAAALREQLEADKAIFKDNYKQLLEKSVTDFASRAETAIDEYMRRTGDQVKARESRRELSALLDEAVPDPEKVFVALQRVATSPSVQNLGLFSKVLGKFQSDPEIANLLQRGLNLVEESLEQE